MKKLLLSFIALATASLTIAQKDISVQLDSPVTGDVIEAGVDFNLTFTVTNNGPSAMVVGDTVAFGITVDGQDVLGGFFLMDRTNGDVPVGGTFDFTTPLSFPQVPDNNDHDFCVMVLLQDSDSSNVIVTETDMLNNMSCSTITFDGGNVGVETEGDVIANSAIVFPNPAVAEVNFEFTGSEVTELAIYDLNGAAVYTTTSVSKTEKVNVSNLESGIYIYKVKYADGQVIQDKLMVK
ncbi:T9SS type A sorting domain-containing protein [Brumimicrobium oceani]|uniref:Secretion system C-terminal sorting domain-containing protein n=1 Tax=Brumimicrobium oceani TaxID=2100725 RepID=A0A2U2XFC6_9FLAO|nr:T9SS type A sorting domain-containing protein [Brumimicrobium oceani]PWH86457.1 hypothetical protein DIT68_04260 [Brumimicrobium oceani]